MKKLNTILLVDDDPINNFINKRLLNKLGIADSVRTVKNGKEAFKFIKEKCESDKPGEFNCPEFIILDNLMPVMDGREFMENLNRENLPNRNDIVILALVATSTKKDVEEFKKLGVNEFTYKPLSEEIVMEIYQKYWVMV